MKKVLTVVAASIVGVAALEVGFRIFKPFRSAGTLRAYEYDPDMGYRLKPGLNLTRITDHLEEVHSNRLGTVNYQEDFGGYPALVFAVGDSYTMGIGLPPDAAYPFQLDLILNRDEKGLYAKRYGVVNLGMAGMGAEQHLLQLRRYAVRLGMPAVVLYLGCDNDFQDDLLFRNGSRHTFGVEATRATGRFCGCACGRIEQTWGSDSCTAGRWLATAGCCDKTWGWKTGGCLHGPLPNCRRLCWRRSPPPLASRAPGWW